MKDYSLYNQTSSYKIENNNKISRCCHPKKTIKDLKMKSINKTEQQNQDIIKINK